VLFTLGGIPIGFAGFLSKDAVIESAYAGMGGVPFWLLVVAALLTSFYSWRLMFLTFWGRPRGDKHTHEHAHESPWSMTAPLAALAVGSVFAGMVWYNAFFGHTDTVAKFFGIPYAEAAEHAEGESAGADAEKGKDAHHYVFAGEPGQGGLYMAPENTVIADAHAVPKWVKVSPFFAMLIGLGTAWLFYIRDPSIPKRLAENQRPLYLFLLNKWYFDEIYDFVFVRPARGVARTLWKRGDGDVIDGTINGVSMGAIPWLTRLAGRAQTGYIFSYAFWMVLGIVILITWMSIAGGPR
jgi:NADH-quinone oxidoreductase subunit L